MFIAGEEIDLKTPKNKVGHNLYKNNMKHFLLTLLLVVLATGLFNCSGDNEYETEYYNGVDP